MNSTLCLIFHLLPLCPVLFLSDGFIFVYSNEEDDDDNCRFAIAFLML